MYRLINIEPSGYSPEAKNILCAFCQVDEIEMSRDEVLSVIPRYEILITRLGYEIDEDFLRRACNLKVIVTATTGLDHIDLQYASGRGIHVLSLKGETQFLRTVTATAEHTWGLVLSLLRKLPFAFQDVLSGSWERNRFKGTELKGKTLGIIGYGRLGRMVATYGKAFGMRVVAHDPHAKDEDIELLDLGMLLAVSDIVSLHVPLADTTHNLIDDQSMAKMKKGAVLVNTSRGKVIDEKALLQALREGRLAGAALDVLADEEYSRHADGVWPASDPLIQYARMHNNLLLTPHIGGLTSDSVEVTEIFMARKLQNYLRHHVS